MHAAHEFGLILYPVKFIEFFFKVREKERLNKRLIAEVDWKIDSWKSENKYCAFIFRAKACTNEIPFLNVDVI